MPNVLIFSIAVRRQVEQRGKVPSAPDMGDAGFGAPGGGGAGGGPGARVGRDDPPQKKARIYRSISVVGSMCITCNYLEAHLVVYRGLLAIFLKSRLLGQCALHVFVAGPFYHALGSACNISLKVGCWVGLTARQP